MTKNLLSALPTFEDLSACKDPFLLFLTCHTMCLFVLDLCYVPSSGPLVEIAQGHRGHIVTTGMTCWANFFDVFETLPAGGM